MIPDGDNLRCVNCNETRTTERTEMSLTKPTRPSLIVVDDFLASPDSIRALALSQSFAKDGSAGQRSAKRFHDLMDPAVFEALLGAKIPSWDKYPINGKFQICTSPDPIVHHSDEQAWAASVFLTPNAPPEAGLSLVKNRRGEPPQESNFFDSTVWEKIDRIGNVYNRLVLWRSDRPHAASCYFGTNYENGRLFWMFFFDAEA